MIPLGFFKPQEEWRSYPITNRGYAMLAGADPRANKVEISGPVRYCRTDYAVKNFERLARGGPCVLCTSFSDASVTDSMMRLLPSNVKRWFSQNVATDDPRAIATPIGLRNSGENIALLVRTAIAGRLPRTNLLYVNFSQEHPAYKQARSGLYERFEGKPWVTASPHVTEDLYYPHLAAHDFILSPTGAGPDCHRHWEAIALGAIPVLIKSQATRIFDDLPAVQVEDWAEVTEERLLAELPALLPRFTAPAMRKSSMACWRERIEEAPL